MNEVANEYLSIIYKDEKKKEAAYKGISALIDKYKSEQQPPQNLFTERDAVLISYGDSLKRGTENPLAVLKEFADEKLAGMISAVHILPFFPYSSDDGFSVMDYYQVNPELGDWTNVEKLNENFELMFDLVLNHISSKSEWFEKYLAGEEGFENLAIETDPNADISGVTRPRALPLLHEYTKADGSKVHLWTTFSRDQIDLNFDDVKTFLRMMEVLLYYFSKGAKIIRLDAIAYLWKELGSSCIHLPQTHAVVKLMRLLADECFPGSIILTETNVPHKENVSYFGDGEDEAQMVYNFSLPPLIAYSFLKENALVMSEWAASLETPGPDTTFFNFTASHDGVGVRPLEGIVPAEEVEELAELCRKNGGRVSYKNNSDGSKSPYELNITYVDFFARGDKGSEMHAKRFLASQAIAMVLPGVPAFYIHSILGSHNYEEGVEKSGAPRSINREKLDYSKVKEELETGGSFRNMIYSGLQEMLKVRRSLDGFAPDAGFKVLDISEQIFAVSRFTDDEILYCFTNVTSKPVEVDMRTIGVTCLNPRVVLGEHSTECILSLEPYETLWILE